MDKVDVFHMHQIQYLKFHLLQDAQMENKLMELEDVFQFP
jgi:hypothetical protein